MKMERECRIRTLLPDPHYKNALFATKCLNVYFDTNWFSLKRVPRRYFDTLTGLNSHLFYSFLLQVIIPASWFFPFILDIPKFLALNVKDNACNPINREWPEKASFLLWSITVVSAMVLMVGLYSRIVYTLWLKRDPDNQLTFQQRVSINKLK